MRSRCLLCFLTLSVAPALAQTSASAATRTRCPADSVASRTSPHRDSLAALADRGWWNLEGGDLETGIAQTEAALRGGLRDPVVYYNFGIGLFLRQRPDNALAAFSEAAQLWPECAWPWERTADILKYLGRATEAEEARQKASSRAPGRPF